jgi:hypothetical protein
MNFKKITLLLIAGLFLSAERNANAQSATFNFTGSAQTFTVPCGVTSITVDMAAAQGGSGAAKGGRVQCTYSTVGSTVFNIYVGGQGGATGSAAAGGFNGGGSSGNSGGGSFGSGGGGGTDIRVGGVTFADRVIVAGGGGGLNTVNGGPGAGGGLIGANEFNTGNTCFATFATGGTQVAGGIDASSNGTCCTFVVTPNGSLGLGGNGAGPSVACNAGDGGGGGGGGWYGGGGGGGYGSGAGGSNWTNGSCSAITNTQGFQSGNGYVTLTWTTPIALSSVTGNVVTNDVCNGGNTGSASETIVTGNASPFTYVWTPSAQTNATATGLTAGTYTVKVTDNCGNTATASITITQPVALTVTTGSIVNEICNGNNIGSAKATAGGGTGAFTYTWTPSGGNAATASNLTAGTYTITVKDANGCSATASAAITQPALLTVTTGSIVNELCNGNNIGSAKATAAGGTGAFTYTWTPSGGNAATANNLTAGTYTITVKDANGCSATASATITQPTVLTVTTGSIVNELCNGSNTGSAKATAAGGTLAYTYTWAPSGGNAATASGLTAGTYTITVTDANGCSATASATITQPATSVTVTTGSIVNELCNGNNIGSAKATAAGGTGAFTYNWAPSGGNAATANSLTAGTYTITVKDANGCSATASATITEPAVLTVTTGSVTNILCNGGNNGNITATPSGGTVAYNYSWSDANTQAVATATGLTAGTYTVTVTDANGCSATASATITEPAVLTVSTGSIVNILCGGGNNGSITATPSGGTAAYNYSWSDANTQAVATATGLTAGTYTVTVTDANGCSATASAAITEPATLTVSTGSITNIQCNGGNNGSATATPAGGTGAYTYSWSDANTQTVATATGLVAGTYTVTLTDANGCSATAIAVITEPAVLTVSTTPKNISCNGAGNGSITATPAGGTSAYTYSWAPGGQTGASATGLVAGTYTVTVTDANGCTATAIAVITEPTALTVSTGFTENILCNGGNNGKTLATPSGGTGAYTYAWAPGGQTNASAAVLVAGTYTVTVTDANGCTATAIAVITEPTALTVTGTATDTAVCKGNCTDVNATAGGGTASYTYAWNTGATTSSVNVCPLAKTTYSVTLTDANGCTNTATVTVDVNPCLGVNEVASLDDMIKFYPNPFTQSVNVDISVNGPVTVTIFNMVGQNVGAYTMDKGLNTLNTSNMAPGIYLMQVKTQSGILNKKLVKVD